MPGFCYNWAMNEQGTVQYRLGWGSIVILLGAAGIGDLLSLIPFVGDFVGPVFWVIVAIYLYTRGFGLLNPGRLAAELISLAAKMIPIIQEFPELLAGMAAVIILSRFEDRTGMKVPLSGSSSTNPLNSGGARLPAGAPVPLNSEGVRLPSGNNRAVYENANSAARSSSVNGVSASRPGDGTGVSSGGPAGSGQGVSQAS